MLTRKCDICGAKMRMKTPRYKIIFDGWLYTQKKDICTDCFKRIAKEIRQADTPQTGCGDFADRLAYERGIKHAWEVAQKVFDSTVTFYEAEDVARQIDKDINVRSKDEPTTQTETQNSNLTFEKQIDCLWK